MRVLVDCYELIRGRGLSMGIYRYAQGLVRALPHVTKASRIEWLIMCNSHNCDDFKMSGAGEISVIDDGPQSKRDKFLWDAGRAALVLRRFGADVYYSPRGFVPRGMDRCARDAVITVHDMIPFYYSPHCRSIGAALENAYITRRMLSSIRRAKAVMTVSNASAREIERLSGRRAGVRVVHNGVGDRGAPRVEKSRKHVFSVVSGLRHKNLEGVVRGYAHYAALAGEGALPLVLCGVALGDCAQWTSDARVLSKITCVSRVSDEQLDELYASSAVCVALSRIEGFGYPPLEALRAGAPVVASDIPAHREVLRDACDFVDPEHHAAVGQAIAYAVERGASRTSDDLLMRYTWAKCASAFVAGLCEELGIAS